MGNARFEKAATGIVGFDETTSGGLPRGRVTVVTGGPGSGKTLFALETLVRGLHQCDEQGIFVAFEESSDEVIASSSSLDWRLEEKSRHGIEFFDAQLSPAVVSGGTYDLIGLLAMLQAKAKQIGARRIVFDGIDVLLAQLRDPALVRREMFRLRDWVHEHRLTGIVTAKTGHGVFAPTIDVDELQFMAACVVSLQHRVIEGTAIRYLRVSKYRGSGHSANEIPFTITRAGIELAGIAPPELLHPAFTERLSTGIERLDAMIDGGYFRGSSVLISGAPGTSKTSLAASFAAAACERGERTVFVSYDEAPDPLVRNMSSIGLDLARHVQSGTLRLMGRRSSSANPEVHVANIRDVLSEHKAQNLVVDPLSALGRTGNPLAGEHAALALLDVAKQRGTTTVCTSLLPNALQLSEATPMAVSTIADTWMHVSYVNQGGERNRALTVIKARGTAHSRQVRELVLSASGITLADVYSSGGEVLMGTLRWEKETEHRRARAAAEREFALREKSAELALAEAQARGTTLEHERELRQAELERIRAQHAAEVERLDAVREGMLARRGADALVHPPKEGVR